MTTYRIFGFDEGPHWDSAIVEAESPEAARAALLAVLTGDDRPETAWTWRDDEPQTAEERPKPEDWLVTETSGPVLFVIGSGCR